MNYDEFLGRAASALQAFLDLDPAGPGCGARVGIRDVNKLQGESYRGLTIRFPGDTVSASFNAMPFYRAYREGRPFEEVLEELRARIRPLLERTGWSVRKIDLSYKACRDRLMLELISCRGNEEQLQHLPHRRIEDLALIYRLDFGHEKETLSTAVITGSLLEHFGLTGEALYRDAMEVVPVREPLVLCPLCQVLEDMTGFSLPEKDPPFSLYVASNTSRIMGASVLAYPDFCTRALEVLGEDFYIIPSSIHEVLLLPLSLAPSGPSLPEMVRTVNRFQVSPEERLSDNVYIFRASEGRIRLADLPGNGI